MPLRSLRNSAAPSSCCFPPAASGPVRTVRKPILSGSKVCANTRGAGSMLIAAPALSSVRRDIPNLPFRTGILVPPRLPDVSLAAGNRLDDSDWSADLSASPAGPTPDQPQLFDNIRTSNDFCHHHQEGEQR